MRRARFILAFVQFVDVLALGVIVVTIPATAGRFGLAPWAAVATLLIVPVTAALAAPPLRRASDRWGRKPVLVATGLLTAEALFVAAWAADVYMLVLSRLALGVAVADVAVVVAAGTDLVRHHGAGRERLPFAARGYLLGAVGAPLLTFALSPFGYGGPAYGGAVLAVIALIEVVALFEETCPAGCEDGRAPVA